MKSLTKAALKEEQIEKIIHNVLNETIISFSEVNNGFYNAIYKITLRNRNVYLKIAPDSSIDILTYEKDIIKRESKLNKLFNRLGIPGPTVLYEDFSKTIIPNNYYIMSEVSGRTIFELKDEIKDKKPYYKEIMKFFAILHNEEVGSFGYDNQRKHFDNYYDTVNDMFHNLKIDADRKNVEFTAPIYEILEKLNKHKDLLNSYTTPSILHFDAWDGNIMIDKGQVTALIDNERSFNGPRIADFVALSFDIFDEEYNDLIHVYNMYADEKIHLSENDRIVYNIHKAYLFLIMYVECAYRDINGSFDWQKKWATETLFELNEKI
jgi:aminoglycoside phosphotransferase (APT) family kinase protein